MPVITEEFKPRLYIDSHTKTPEFAYIPKVTVFVKVDGKLYPFKIEAIVDSGASRNLFPAEILTSLGIELVNGKKRSHFGIGDREVVAYIHKVEIIIGNQIIKTEIDFSAEHKPHLLGVEKFFEYFDSINFNMEKLQVELSYSTKKN